MTNSKRSKQAKKKETTDVLSTLSAVIQPSKAKKEPHDFVKDEPYLSLEHIESGTGRIINYDSANNVKSTKHVFQAGDVLYGKLRPYLNKVAVADRDGVCSTDILVFHPNEHVHGRFLQYWLSRREVVSYANHLSAGIGMPRISFKELGKLDFPRLSVAEQEEIATALDRTLSRVRVARERIEKARKAISDFRKSLLWSISEDYEKQPLGSLLVDLRYGTAKRCEYDAKGLPVLRIPNIGEGVVSMSDLKFAQFTAKEQEKLSVHTDDILMIRSNGSTSLVGKVALVGAKAEGSIFAGYLMRLRANRNIINPQFLAYALSSMQIRQHIEKTARSTSGVHNINSSEVEALMVPVPPLPIQETIVKRLTGFFEIADRVEKRLSAVVNDCEVIIASVFAKAFDGQK